MQSSCSRTASTARIGETVSGTGGLDGEAERTLRVLMYHKVNDLWPNPTTVPTEVFAEQMALLGELGYAPSRSSRCEPTTSRELRSRAGAVLITFDDGYRDNLQNASRCFDGTAIQR